MKDTILSVKYLTKTFGSFTAVDNLSFAIKEGEVLGLLGQNGAGKTTTIQMLLGVTEASRGTISYFGKPLLGAYWSLSCTIDEQIAYLSFCHFEWTRFLDSHLAGAV
jgi:ABC-type multidrug transport system ATPase subunit